MNSTSEIFQAHGYSRCGDDDDDISPGDEIVTWNRRPWLVDCAVREGATVPNLATA